MEHYLKISGSPELKAAIENVASALGSAFVIESDEELNDPAKQGFKLSKAVAIVSIVSGILTSADLTEKIIKEMEHSHAGDVQFETSQGTLKIQLDGDQKFSPEQRQEIQKLFDSMLK